MASSSLRRLEGKVAIITGAASGIGATTAKLFVKHGAKVLIADIQDDLGQKVAKELGSSAIFVHCDVTVEADVEHVVNTAVAKYGKLDIMYNNAGIVGASIVPNILENTQSDFQDVIRVNLVGYFLGTKHAARVMIPNRKGCIISTASVAGVVGGGLNHAYASSKSAIIGLTKNTAVELGDYGIRVNCISPYLVDTPMTRSLGMTDEDFKKAWIYVGGRELTKEDIADAALYLASDESKYVNGHNLVVDGGFSSVNQGFNFFAPSK